MAVVAAIGLCQMEFTAVAVTLLRAAIATIIATVAHLHLTATVVAPIVNRKAPQAVAMTTSQVHHPAIKLTKITMMIMIMMNKKSKKP